MGGVLQLVNAILPPEVSAGSFAKSPRLQDQREQGPCTAPGNGRPCPGRPGKVPHHHAAPHQAVGLLHALLQLYADPEVQNHNFWLPFDAGVPTVGFPPLPSPDQDVARVGVAVYTACPEGEVRKHVHQQLPDLLRAQPSSLQARGVGDLAAVNPLHSQDPLRAESWDKLRHATGANTASWPAMSQHLGQLLCIPGLHPKVHFLGNAFGEGLNNPSEPKVWEDKRGC
mmetsp:Transcript_4944/g.13818  ORF Transcript_4944/g.13818 Transcript_4944/m.13818 type:complete len:227 (+) Transcript_4944:297-977(+)